MSFDFFMLYSHRPDSFGMTKLLFLDECQISGGLSTRANIELFKDTVHMVFDCPDFDHKLFGNLLVGQAFANQFQHFQLAVGKISVICDAVFNI